MTASRAHVDVPIIRTDGSHGHVPARARPVWNVRTVWTLLVVLFGDRLVWRQRMAIPP